MMEQISCVHREVREWIEAWNQSDIEQSWLKSKKMEVQPSRRTAFCSCLGADGQQLQESYDGNSGKQNTDR